MNKLMEQLARQRDRGAISEMAYQFCRFMRRIEPDCPNGVLLAGCLAVTRKEEGDVCIALSREAGSMLFSDRQDREERAPPALRAPELDAWRRACEASICVGSPGETALLILDEADRLYLHKYWKYERELADTLLAKARPAESEDGKELPTGRIRAALDRLFPDGDGDSPDWQKVAAYTAATHRLAVISGGPGTGKTSTVVRILMVLERLDAVRHVALAAPTGKAADRLRGSVAGALDRLDTGEELHNRIPESAYTIHKLLGARRQSSSFRYGRDNPLPYDLVVVDEASMVDLALMHRLVVALPQHARLILLGDKDQLASVEAGAVLGSICTTNRNMFSRGFLDRAAEAGVMIPESAVAATPEPLTDHIVLLKKSYRFDETSGIGTLAARILEGRPEEALAVLKDESTHPDVRLKTVMNADGFKAFMENYGTRYVDRLREEANDEVEQALQHLTRMGILCVHRRGPLGAEQVNRLVEGRLRKRKIIPAVRDWYPGRPVMATRNDYALGLRNGDMGVALNDGEGELKVYFRDDESGYRSFYPSRLSAVETAFAITVHKSQGSEFDDVTVVLPQQLSPISTRELLYTAVTRARVTCTIVGSEAVLAGAIRQKAERSSGLEDRLWKS